MQFSTLLYTAYGHLEEEIKKQCHLDFYINLAKYV